MEEERFFSKHTFMFPFQWDYLDGSKKSDLYNRRTNLVQFDRLFSSIGLLQKKSFFIGGNARKYNEYTYFHPFVRSALYYKSDDDLVRYYELDQKDGKYIINILKNGEPEGETFELALDSICMHVFDTGVGVLSFNLTNHKYSAPEAILKINDFGRRIYPQYLDEDNRLKAKENFLANKITGRLGRLDFEEDFSAYENEIDAFATFLPPDHILKVFGYAGHDRINDSNKNFVFTRKAEHKNCIRIRQVTDDRMFFLCYYNNKKLANQMGELFKEADFNEVTLNYEQNEFWHAFIFGDGQLGSVYDKFLQKEEIKTHSYTRWLNTNPNDIHSDSALYGISRDSFVCLGNWPELGFHMQSIYYQMAVLCLTQRASSLRFSFEISEITRQLFNGKNIKSNEPIKELYQNYIKFINRVYFREVSSQIQGIELYDILQKHMELDSDVKELDNEMEEVFQYSEMMEQAKLSRVANLYLPIAAVAGFLGINTFITREPSGEDGAVGLLNKSLDIMNLNFTWGDLITILLLCWIVYAVIRSLAAKK